MFEKFKKKLCKINKEEGKGRFEKINFKIREYES